MMVTSPPSATKSCIEISELSLWYGDFQALNNVTLNIPDGQLTGLIGPSGCGKTTLLRCINRINERYGNVRTSGQVRVMQKNVYDHDVSLIELRKTVGMVFQRPNPLPISIYNNVMFGQRLHVARSATSKADRDAMVEAALREVALWDAVKDKLHRRATHLTLEQQQKLCIARLLPLKPKVILMDEPCSALDAEGTAHIEDLLDTLAGKYTVVIVTHNMAQARRVSESCIFMLMGELIEHASTADMFTRPKNEKTAMYIEGRYG
jgi:phosphate transport system ATP-binding protein